MLTTVEVEDELAKVLSQMKLTLQGTQGTQSLLSQGTLDPNRIRRKREQPRGRRCINKLDDPGRPALVPC